MAARADIANVEPALARIMALVAESIPFDWGGIALFDAGTHTLTPYRRAGVDAGVGLRRLAPVPLSKGVIGRVAQAQQPVFRANVASEPGDPLRHPDTRAEIAVPLVFDGRLLGVLSVERYAADAFSEAHVKQLETIADLAAMAIDQAYAVAAEQARREHLERVQAVTRAINSQVQMQALLNLAVWEAAAIFDVPAVSITLFEIEHVTPHTGAEHGLSEAFEHGLRAPLVEVADAPVYCADLRAVAGDQADLVAREDLRSMLAVPLKRGGQRLGSLNLYSRGAPRDFDEEDMALAQALADHVAVAVDNVRLLETLERHAQESSLANRLKSEFLANVSHELRTPMNAIIGFTETLLNEIYGPITEKQADRLETVRRNAYDLLGLIDNMLTLSNIEAGRAEVTIEPVYLQQEIEGAVVRHQARASAKGLALQAVIAEPLPPVRGDTTRVRQVLDTLVDNAIKFTEAGGIVLRADASARDERRWVRCAVQDTGIGVAPRHHEMIFDAFNQVDGSSTREHGGTGLGLAIARKLVEMMGGRIWIESEGVPGQGSTFFFELPAVAQPEAAEDADVE